MQPETGLGSYSLITAADAKITLSMGPVNPKPQHLVFRCQFGNPSSKYSHSACGNRKTPCKSQVFDLRIAPNTVQKRPGGSLSAEIQAYCAIPVPHKAQTGCISGQFAVRNRAKC